MKLLNLKLVNYRNIENLDLDFASDKVLIIGKNAQGKTNILESIYLLSTLKSSRTSNNVELIRFGADLCQIGATIKKTDEITLDWSYSNEKKRTIAVNKLKTRPKEFKTVLKTVLFSSSDLMLLRGNPSDRRDWLDNAISQIYPAYDERLSKYDKIRIQKNNCLKEDRVNEALLEVYNEQLVITGSNIIFLRLKFLKEIEKIAREKHSAISVSEDLGIKYSCEFLENEQTVDEIAVKFALALEEKKQEEIRRKQAVVGAHRDDVAFFINNTEATKFASQGQQRTIVLALKLAELDIITEKTGDEPVLLLDDVLAELDDLRQNFLLKSIKSEIQTIITSVDTLLFDKKFLEGVKIYNIENGKIK